MQTTTVGKNTTWPCRWRAPATRLALAALAAGTLLPQAAHCQWITDLETGVVANSNLGNAQAGPDVHRANGVTASVSTGPFVELSPGNNLLLTAQAKQTAFGAYTAQDNLAVGLTAKLDHKFGLGRETPHAYALASQTRLEFRDGLRSGWLQALTVGSRCLFGDRLVLRGEVGLERRTGSSQPALRAGLPGNVFDQSARLATVGADYSLTENLLLQVATTLRRGDADYIETTSLADSFDGAGAVARDPAFGPSVFIEKVQTHALLFDVGASWALGEHASLNLIFRRQLTIDNWGALYTRSIPALTYQYRFD